jgi:hypothetical protein
MLLFVIITPCSAVAEHSSHQPLVLEAETFSEMLDTSTSLTQLITQEDFILYCCCEH